MGTPPAYVPPLKKNDIARQLPFNPFLSPSETSDIKLMAKPLLTFSLLFWLGFLSFDQCKGQKKHIELFNMCLWAPTLRDPVFWKKVYVPSCPEKEFKISGPQKFSVDISDIFNFFSSGEGKGESEAPRQGGGRSFIENPRRFFLERGGAKGPGRCLRGIRGG